MDLTALQHAVEPLQCRIIGAEQAGGAPHRQVIAALARGFDSPGAVILCEPTIARGGHRPPDVVVIAPEVGVQVVEVKQFTLEQIEAIEPGGQCRIRYASGTRRRNVLAQVRAAMFDIKDAVQRLCPDELIVPFGCSVVFPCIRRADWMSRFGPEAYCPEPFIFAEDMAGTRFADRLMAQAGRLLAVHGRKQCPADQLKFVFGAFGDSSVLYPEPRERPARQAGEGTLGELFDEAAESYKTLSEDQQRLSSQNWDEGPRLVRGVAGSGKTIVLANNLARRLARSMQQTGSLHDPAPRPPRLLAVCFNRALVPFLKKKIAQAYRQRTGSAVPVDTVEVFAFNRLMWHLSQRGLWRYQRITAGDEDTRAQAYRRDLESTFEADPELAESTRYDAVYVDEGQDFEQEEFRLLQALCRQREGAEPNLYIFYDDAQNLYARRRPNWQSLQINVRGGRAHVMDECYRNTRQIIEPAFNVLYGTCAEGKASVPSRDFADLLPLEQKGLLGQEGGLYRVRFAHREGMLPRITTAPDPRHEAQAIVQRLRWLLIEQQVRPEDILVLAMTRQRTQDLVHAIDAAKLPVARIHLVTEQKDRLLGASNQLTVSTVASAKGYDKYCVLMASVQSFGADVKGRAAFYVGCTRAIEYLELFGLPNATLIGEFQRVMARLGYCEG